MGEVQVETGVDDLIELLRDEGKIAIKDAATKLKTDESFVQAWVDFLVEEAIVGVEYKFTKPFIFLNDATSAKNAESSSEKKKGLLGLKEEYIRHAKEKKVGEEKALELWKKHLHEALEKRKDYFLREVAKRNLNNADILFEQYKEMLERV